MRPLTCPECRASLDAETIASTGVWECPYCGKPLPDVTEEPTEVSPRDEPLAEENGIAAVSDSPPAGSRIEVYEASSERLVLLVPPGGKEARGLGCFATFWNLFMVVFTSIWVTAGPLDLAPLALIGLFWLVGIGLVIGWVKLKHERTLLLVEPARVVVQHILFGRKRQKETELFSKSRATLAEAHSQNDVPVYSVAIDGKNRTIRFGTSLSNGEKDWIVDRINALIAPGESASLTQDGANADEVATNADDESLPDPEGELPEAIHIIEDDADRLSFWIPAVTFAAARWGMGLAGGLFSLVWFGGIASTAGGLFTAPDLAVRIVAILFFVPFGVAGLMPLAMSLFAWHGRITATLDREQLTARWHVGPFGLTRTMPFADIANVRRSIPPDERARPRNARPANAVGPECCVVISKRDHKYLLLTFLDDDPIVRHLTALVKRKWQSLRPASAASPMTNDQ